MNKQYTNKIVFGGALLLVVIFAIYYFNKENGFISIFEKPVVISENLVIPQTEKVTLADVRTLNTNAYNVPLVPRRGAQEVSVPQAVYTLKESYTKSSSEALSWSSDAKLVLIKSLGAVTLEGKSSQWQVIFGSQIKGKGYEVVIQADQIVSKKEITADGYGYVIPKNWYEASAAIVSLQTLPGFSDATVSGINFYYNTDAKEWRYGFATSKGATSMPVR